MKKLLLAVGAICVLVASTSCSNNSSYQSDNKESNQSSDWAITARVKKALVTNGVISGKSKFVSVSTTNGVVTLTGKVSCKDDIRTVVDIVRDVDGVVGVDNQLTYENS